MLADAGWTVTVLEAQPEPGGAVRSAELLEPGFTHDVFSSFYPLAAASPAIRALELERWGLRWRHGPLVLAHPARDGSCASLSRSIDETAASLDRFAAGDGDGDAWRSLFHLWQRVRDDLLQGMVTPTPPVRVSARILRELRVGGTLDLVRLGLLPVRRFADENFGGEGGARLVAGNALHADFTPESALGGFFGWFLTCLGQDVGFPFPEGGAGRLTDALVARLRAHGGELVCSARVDEIVIRRGRAVGVRTAGGDVVEARRAVLADVDAPRLYLELVGEEHLPARVVGALRRFEWEVATFKVDWTLDGAIPWAADDARRAPVVHVTEGIDELTVTTGELARGLIPERPFLVLGQYSMGDETRAPDGKETAWAYTHVPHRVRGDAAGRLTGAWDESDSDEFADRITARIEELAPGFGRLVRGRHVLTPGGLEARNANLRRGALNGGTAQLHQQLAFRPVPGLGRPATPVRGLYLASASAHPGGGVHGAPGAIAARAALNAHRLATAATFVGAGAAALGLVRRR